MINRKGFSLIEVLAAVTILSGVLFAVARIISASYIYASKIHNIYLGTELTRLKLHEVEEIIKKDGLPEMETEEEGEFEENEYKDFKWKYSIKKVFIPLPDLSGSADGTEGQAEAAAGMLSLAKGNIEDFFKERIRKLTLTVFWGNGDRESERVVFTVFLTTPGTVKSFQQFQGNPSQNNGSAIPDGDGKRKSDPNYNRFRPPSGKDMMMPPSIPQM